MVARCLTAVLVAALAVPPTTGCGIIGPSCMDDTGSVLNVSGQALPSGVNAYEVVSPKNSNLVMRLTWTEASATLGLRATIVNCGQHAGCIMDTMTPPFGPGGTSPVPQPWPAGLREMLVDGTRGKTYRVEVTGDPDRQASFALVVTYQITCES